MSIELLRRSYLRKDVEGNVIETPEEMYGRVAEHIAQSADEVHHFQRIMSNHLFLPNSPTLMNAGTDLGQLQACFVLPLEDSMEDIFATVRNAALIQKSGGGVGFSFSKLRPQGDKVRSTGGAAGGPLPFIEVLDSSANTVKQGGKRNGANMAVLRVDHPDIKKFVTAKADEDDYLTNFNLSVGATDKFIEAVFSDDSFELTNPRNNEVVEVVKARELFDLIIDMAHRNGEPGLLYLDTINKYNPTPKLGEIESTNPCGETPLLPFEACNLGSVNLAKMVKGDEIDWRKLFDTVQLGIRFLDNVIDVNEYPLPEVKQATLMTRKIGLGVMGLAEMLVRLNIKYDSKEALELADKLAKYISNAAKIASRELAKERGPFPAYEEYSVYDTSIRNATRTTIAPTGSLSYIAGTTGGIEPYFDLEFTRSDREDEEVNFRIDPELIEKADEEVLVGALDITPDYHVKMLATWQKHVDNAVSKTINLPENATHQDVREAFILGHKLGCKGITIYRDGSRERQVLNTKSRRKGIRPRERAKSLEGQTLKYKTGCGKILLTVNRDPDGDPVEVIINDEPTGGCTIMTEAVGRLISHNLRAGMSSEEVIRQLKKTHSCPNTMRHKGSGTDIEGRSCPDIIGRALEYALNEKETEEVNRESCPNCGNLMDHTEGCITCPSCGYGGCN